MIPIKHHASEPICDKCGKPCTAILMPIREEYPDGDQNGMHSRVQECWVSECCHAGYEFLEPDDTDSRLTDYDHIGEY